MSLNETVSAERVHISFFGKRNAGKSSLVNAVTGQNLAVVSDVLGTTTDPVKKAMELFPIGPVLIIDTPGFDDEGELGKLRVKKTKEVLNKTDVAVFVVDGSCEMTANEKEFLSVISDKNIPYIVVYNKADLLSSVPENNDNCFYASAKTGFGINELKNKIGKLSESKKSEKKIVSDLLSQGDAVILVTPIDESAPKGRLILPQQQTVRDIIDTGCIAIVCKPSELEITLSKLSSPPKMVITDSQAFSEVNKIVPENIPLTSFSILFARYKGDLFELIKGAREISKLKTGDKVLVSEGCTHHRQCGDIGTVKLPRLLERFTGEKPVYSFTSGGEFPENLSEYKLIIHCGGCMLNETQMKHRIQTAKNSGVPIVNYGIAIAHMNGILERSTEIFKDIV